MRKKIAAGLIGMGLGWGTLAADVSEMIFTPEADFSEGVFHFNYHGERHRNHGFVFEKGFDTDRIVYIRPLNHRIEKQKDGTVKVSFPHTDRYSYLQRAHRDDFLVSDENGIVTILLSGGDCTGSAECVTAENILTVTVPKGYRALSYRGLDQDLNPLANPMWQRKGNTFTLSARDVKGACIMMELKRLGSAEAADHAPLPLPKKETVVAPAQKPAAVPAEQPSVARTSEAKVAAPAPINREKTAVTEEVPAPYFRNFQLFENRSEVTLSQSGKERLEGWVRAFKAGGYRKVVINGYTDSIPPKRLKHLYATNEILSAARGKVVAEHLVSLGIEPSAITVNGLGALNPVAPNETEAGRSKNRRIEFVLSR